MNMFINKISTFLSEVLTLNNKHKYELIKVTKITEEKYVITCYERYYKVYLKFQLDDIIINDKLKFFNSKDIIVLTKLFYTHKNIQNIENNQCKYLVFLTYFFIILYISSNIAAVKLFQFRDIIFSGGMLIFPMLYVVNDIITEIYGFKYIKKIILQAFFANIILTSILYFLAVLPSYNLPNNEAFNLVFMLTPKIFVASCISYLIGELLNSYLLILLKNYFIGKYFVIRALISTMIGSIIDTSIFFIIVFSNMSSSGINLLKNILILSLVKVIYEIILLPITMLLINFLKNKNKIYE